MMIPDGAIFESFLGTGADGRPIALWDVSALLPKHRTKRYKTRRLEDVRQLYLHHSGRLGAPGFAGLLSSVRYVIGKRGWPGASYHIWIPFENDFDSEGRRIVYRCQPTEVRTYHAGTGPNDRAVAIVTQGNLTTKDMSEHQSNALPVVLDWFAGELGIQAHPIGHDQAPADGHAKASCPGRAGKSWVRGYNAGRDSRRHDSAYA